MRYLKFDVSGMTLTKHKGTKLDNLIAGSKGYLAVMFNFDSDWHGLKKACVWVTGTRENAVPVELNIAKMDDQTASRTDIGFYVVGQGSDGSRLQTNTYRFTQQQGGTDNGKRR